MEGLELKLVKYNWITNDQLNLAREDARKCAKSVWVSLVKLGYISEEDISVFFAQESGFNYIRISDYQIDDEAIRLLDEGYCRANLVIPLFKIKDTLFIASNNPLDAALADNLAKLTGCAIELLFASARSIREALDSYRGPEEKSFDAQKFMFEQNPMQGLSLWRESERLDLNIPVRIKIEDKSLALHCSSPIEGSTRNISYSGTAVGLHIFLFLPKGLNLLLEFKPAENLSDTGRIIQAKGEVVYCRMEKGQHYFLGIRFTEIEDEARKQLFKLAKT